MNRILLLIFITSLLGCQTNSNKGQVIEVASFIGQQITGVTVSNKGRIFVNFPRWREGVESSVVEVFENNLNKPFPDKAWNSWEIGSSIYDSIFVAVQSVVAFEHDLYVLDTRNPLFQGVVGQPCLFVFDLQSNKLKSIYKLDSTSFYTNSYINDLRVDKKNQKVYFTDSGRGGLVILDLVSGRSRRVLDKHYSTLAETDHLSIDGEKWSNSVDSDGIALDVKNDRLFYHALTGYTLYSVDTRTLINGTEDEIERSVKSEGKTAAPDGMIFDEADDLYYADLENHKIMYITPEGNIKILVEGDKIKWADSFSIFDGYLYFTNSRIHEAKGDISEMDFTLNKISLPTKYTRE